LPVTSNDGTAIAEPQTGEQIGAALRALMKGHPGFRFCRVVVGWHGHRWIAEREHGLTPGLHTVITEHLGELEAALTQDRDRVATTGAR
jgi:hypothetical protein